MKDEMFFNRIEEIRGKLYKIAYPYFNSESTAVDMVDELEYVELLDADREIVTLDLNTMEFSDSKGILPELTKAEYNDSYDAYCYKLTGEKNWKTDFLFSHFIDKKGRSRFISSGMADEGEYLLFLVPHDGTAQKKAYINSDNQVTLVRNFPDKVIKPNLTIELEQ